MASQVNNIVIEGNLVRTAVIREDGHVEATIQNHEEWANKEGDPRTRENMFGVIATPNTRAAAALAKMTPGTGFTILGSLRTVEEPPGPRGGLRTKTKIHIRKILFHHQ